MVSSEELYRLIVFLQLSIRCDSMYTIETRGAIKYLVKDGKRITRGHHDFSIDSDGCIIGKLGAYIEPVLTSTGQVISHIGADGFFENERIKERAVLAHLNGEPLWMSEVYEDPKREILSVLPAGI